MSLVKKLLSGLGMSGRKRAEHAVTVHLELVGGPYGSEDEVEEIRLLGDDCEAALAKAKAGEFEGEEFGDADCVLVFTGRDAERLWSIIAPRVAASRVGRGGHVVKRFGGPGARETKVPIHR